MRYTLGQAARRLAASSGAYGIADVRDGINRAVETLSGMSGWDCLRQVVRISSVGPCFALPQGSAALVRVCVNGHPAHIRGQDFRFLHSGPGDIDLDHPPFGFREVPVRNVLDMGTRSVMHEPPKPFRVFAISDGRNVQPPMKVQGIDTEGRVVDASVTVHPHAVYDDLGTKVSGMELDEAPATSPVFQTVTEVVLDNDIDDYVTLYAEDAARHDRFPVAVYHPSAKVPQFRVYMLQGVPPGRPVEVLAQVRLDPLPLVRESDVIPFDGLDPIEWVMAADWCMKAGEVDKAQKYTERAAQWMKAREVTDDTIQTPMVVNGVFEGSLGEISREAFNV